MVLQKFLVTFAFYFICGARNKIQEKVEILREGQLDAAVSYGLVTLYIKMNHDRSDFNYDLQYPS